MPHFADNLLDAIDRKAAPVCVGIDPVYDRLPQSIRDRFPDPNDAAACVDAIFQWTTTLIRAVAPHVPAVKFQSACFERYGSDGVEAYFSLVQEAKAADLIVIGDVKRGDIGASAEHYAAGCLLDPPFIDFEDLVAPDAITVSAYFGEDGLRPFTDTAANHGKGVFALVRTSNPGGDALQSLKLEDGRTVADAVAQLVASLGSDPRYIGSRGYSLLGAVVGATKPQDAARLRQLMPHQIFLVPGFGAQGGSPEDVRACFNPDRSGALITASRSVIFAHESNTAVDWPRAVELAALDLKSQIAHILDT